MKQLTGLDASFLYMETPTTFGHVTGLMIFERPSADFDPYAAVYAKYASLVGELEPMRRRLVEVPFGLDHPVLDRRPQLRSRLPRPRAQPRQAGPGRSARRAGLADRRAADGPHPAAVGGVRHRRPGERTMGAAHQVPPRHHRRRLRPADAGDRHRHRPRRRAAGREPAVGARADPERRRAAAPGDRQPGAQPAARRCGCRPGSPASSPTPPGSPA